VQPFTPQLRSHTEISVPTSQVNLFSEAHKHFPLPEAYAYGIDTYNDIRYTAPWLLPPDQQAKLPYLGLQSNLTALLKVQASHDWVTVFLYTAGHADFTLNCIYSYIHYGKVSCGGPGCAAAAAAAAPRCCPRTPLPPAAPTGPGSPQAHNFVAYTFDNASLDSCLSYKLPCYNATSLLTGQLRQPALHVLNE
jgi:hypothetical protein